MKSSQIKTILITSTLCAAIVTFAGCKKEESVTVTETVTEAVSDASATLKETGEAVKANIEKVATEAMTNAPSIIDQAKVAAIIDQAKALVTDKKYSEALNSLQGLSSFQLTPEQQKLVDDLKAQIQKGMTALKMP